MRGSLVALGAVLALGCGMSGPWWDFTGTYAPTFWDCYTATGAHRPAVRIGFTIEQTDTQLVLVSQPEAPHAPTVPHVGAAQGDTFEAEGAYRIGSIACTAAWGCAAVDAVALACTVQTVCTLGEHTVSDSDCYIETERL